MAKTMAQALRVSALVVAVTTSCAMKSDSLSNAVPSNRKRDAGDEAIRNLLANARRLNDGNNDNVEQYIDDLSGYSIQYGKCVRVKINNYDDDEVEGNQFYYNGRYHAQHNRYASFFLCKDGGQGDGCGNCDYSVEYVTDLLTFIQYNVENVQNYCGVCNAACGRRLDEDVDEEGNEGENAQEYDIDCNVCTNQCANLAANDGGADETEYLNCQESHVDDETGLQYYSAPTCDQSSDEIIIGFFYDDECTVKAASQKDYGFSYSTFRTIEEMCVGCGIDDNANDMCTNFYQGGSHCSNGYNNNANAYEQDVSVCKAYLNAHREQTYVKRKKKSHVVQIVIAVVLVFSVLAFAAYTYYIRHRGNEKSKSPLADQDNDVTADLQADEPRQSQSEGQLT